MASQSFQQFVEQNQDKIPPAVLLKEIPDFQITNPQINQIHLSPGLGSVIFISISGQVTIEGLSAFMLPADIQGMLGDTSVEMAITVTIDTDAKSVSLQLAPKDIDISLSGKNVLQIDQPTFTITLALASKPFTMSYQAQGHIPITIPYTKETLDTEATLTFVEQNGTLTSATAGLVVNPNPPLTLPSVLDDLLTINQVSGEMGLVFKPVEYCKVGLGANVSWATPVGSTPTDFMVVCDVEGDVVVPQYISFNAQKVDLSSLLIGLIKSTVTFPSIPQVALINPSFWWCDNATPLPDGTVAKPGFGFHSYFEVFGLKCYGSMSGLNTGQEEGSFQSNGPISFADGVFTLSGNGKPIPASSGNNNSAILTTVEEVNKANENTENEKTAAPMWQGSGVVFNFSFEENGGSFFSWGSSVSITANGKATFLGVASVDLTVKADKQSGTVKDYYVEIDFDFDTAVSVSETFTLQNGTLTGSLTFALGKEIDLLSQLTYSMPLGASTKITADITVSETSFVIVVHLEIEGKSFSFSSNSLTNCSSVADLVEAAVELVAENASEILAELMSDPKLWVKWITSGAISLVTKGNLAKAAILALRNLNVPYSTQMGNYLAEVQTTLNYAVSDMQTALTEVSHYMPSDKQKILPGTVLGAIGQGFLKEALSNPTKQIEDLYNDYAPQKVAEFMKNNLGSAATDVAVAFHDVGTPVEDAGKALQSVFNITKDTVDEVLSLKGYATSIINSAGGFIDKVKNWFSGIF